MLGITNNIKDRPVYTPDEYTILLLTDTVEDKSPFHNTLINNNVISTNSLLRDNRNSLYFNGSSSISITNSTSNLSHGISAGDWTLELWFYPLIKSGYQDMFVESISSDGNYASILLRCNENMYIGSSGNNSSWNALDTGAVFNTSVNLNEWCHLAITHTGNLWMIFRNGVYQKTFTSSTLPMTPTAAHTWIGQRGSNQQYFKGYMQDLRVSSTVRYTTSFTPPERLI